jgi:heat-inducible transcriptional repressor
MLNERGQRVLCAVVQSYIDNPEPVGSRLVTKRFAFNLSPATIRNIMADLEDLGFLTQPHTSAGRVPTDKGYRFYVDSMGLKEPAGRSATPDRRFVEALMRRIESLRDDMDDLLREATQLLSEMSHSMVFAIPVMPGRTTLNRISLYRYRGSRIVSVLLTNEGAIRNKVMDSDFGLTQRELNRISDFLNSEFGGYTIDEMRSALIEQMSREKAVCDELISRAVAICREALTFPNDEIILSGLSELIGLPEFSSRINDVLKAMEDKRRIVKLLEEMSSAEGVNVVIGSENPDKRLRSLSIVTASYKREGRFLGSVGLIGPTRMDYPRAIAMVDAAARLISTAISR